MCFVFGCLCLHPPPPPPPPQQVRCNCDMDWYTTADLQHCSPCPAFETSPASSASSSACDCNTGFVRNATTGLCEPCATGSYFDNGACSACMMGTTSAPASTSCFVDPDIAAGTSAVSPGPCPVFSMSAPSSANTGTWRLVEGEQRDGSPVYQRDGNGRYLSAGGDTWYIKPGIDGGWFNTFARNSLYPVDTDPSTGYTMRCQCQEGDAATSHCDCADGLVSQGGYCVKCAAGQTPNAAGTSCDACSGNSDTPSEGGECSVPTCATWNFQLTSNNGASPQGWCVCVFVFVLGFCVGFSFLFLSLLRHGGAVAMPT